MGYVLLFNHSYIFVHGQRATVYLFPILKMNGFISRCILFFIVFFILEKSLIFLRDCLPEKELDKRLEYIITGKINADIVVLGSSRGARDIVASQLADSFHTTAFNL